MHFNKLWDGLGYICLMCSFLKKVFCIFDLLKNHLQADLKNLRLPEKFNYSILGEIHVQKTINFIGNVLCRYHAIYIMFR